VIQTEFKYLIFKQEPQDPKRKTRVWQIWNRSEQCLGVVYWDFAWRQYVSEWEVGCYLDNKIKFSGSCHADVATFLSQVNKEHQRNMTTKSSPPLPLEAG
jgi:hypothetical protein